MEDDVVLKLKTGGAVGVGVGVVVIALTTGRMDDDEGEEAKGDAEDEEGGLLEDVRHRFRCALISYT